MNMEKIGRTERSSMPSGSFSATATSSMATHDMGNGYSWGNG